MIDSKDSVAASPLDPDIYDWCNSIRTKKFYKDLSAALETISWSDRLKPIVMSWITRELVSELLEDTGLWTSFEKSEKLIRSKERWVQLYGSDSTPPCVPKDYDAWYLADIVQLDWTKKLWGHRLETLYLASKDSLDTVSCSLLRVKNQNLSFELYQRLKGEEATFDYLSWHFGEGPERKQGGRYRRQPLGSLPDGVRTLLRKAKPGEVLKPRRMKEWYVLLTLEEFIPAQFDEKTQELLLRSELKTWKTAVCNYLLRDLDLFRIDSEAD